MRPALLASILCLSPTGCLSDDPLDGTWRHPLASVGGERALELVLGQYGPEVAGLVRIYRGSGGGPTADPYLSAEYCTTVERGRFNGDRLRFEFIDDGGVQNFASLRLGDVELTGNVGPADDLPGPERSFVLESSSVDRGCGGRTEPFLLGGIVRVGDVPLPATARAALVYTGQRPDDRFVHPTRTVALDRDVDPPTFSMLLAAIPDQRDLTVEASDGSVRFGFAVFAVFDDLNGDGQWMVDPLQPERSEPALGYALDRALVFLEGQGSAALPERPALLEALPTGYSLVAVVREPNGSVDALAQVDPSSDVVRIDAVPVSGPPPALVP